ncbi:MAG: right-handed parallel beta-helix repeat-containing protein, partial [Candidatus Aenigmatarchaeota archaeon]
MRYSYKPSKRNAKRTSGMKLGPIAAAAFVALTVAFIALISPTSYTTVKISEFTEELRLTISSDYEHGWSPQAEGELRSIAMSGRATLDAGGYARIYITNGAATYLVYEAKRSILSATGDFLSALGRAVDEFQEEMAKPHVSLQQVEPSEPEPEQPAAEEEPPAEQEPEQSPELPYEPEPTPEPPTEPPAQGEPLQTIAFDEACKETCSMSGFSGPYTLVFEVANATLELESISYSIAIALPEAPEATPTPSPTPEATPEPTPEATVEPTPEETPTPTPEITPAPTPSPTPESALAGMAFAKGQSMFVEGKDIGKKVADDPAFEVYFTLISLSDSELMLRFYHNATDAQRVWVEKIDDVEYSLSHKRADPLEEVSLNVTLVNGSVPRFRLHVGRESEIFEFGTLGFGILSTNLTSCGTLNVAGETYLLTADIIEHVGTCMIISANNITLDCQGHTIDGDDSGTDYGVSNTVAVIGTTIKNCRIRDFYRGVLIGPSSSYSNYTAILNNTFESNTNADIYLARAYFSRFENNAFLGSSAGLQIGTLADFSDVINNTFEGINNIAISIGSSSARLINNTVTNSGTGVNIVASNVTLINNTFDNNRNGISIGNVANITITSDNKARENSEYDLAVSITNPAYCSQNNITNLTGSGGRPILFYSSAVSLQNVVASEIILCNADGSSLRNVTIAGSSSLKNNALRLVGVDNANITGLNSSDNYYGLYASNCNNLTIANSTLNSNSEDGLSSYSNRTIAVNVTANFNGKNGILSGNERNSTYINVTAQNNAEWDFEVSGSFGNVTFINATSLQNRLSFTPTYTAYIKGVDSSKIPLGFPGAYKAIGYAVNISDATGSLSINFSYTSSDVQSANVNESTLRVWKYNASGWMNETFWSENGVNTAAKVVYANITSLTSSLLAPAGASANPIFGCANLSVAGASYDLASDIINASGTCMNISAHNVTLDCNGHMIDGIGSGYGINNTGGYDNVTIKNCVITDFYYGAYFENDARFGKVLNSALESNTYGIYASNAVNATIAGNRVANNSQYGAILSSVSNSIVSNNTFGSNGVGLVLSGCSNITVNGSAASGNLYGFYIYNALNVSVINSTASENSRYDLQFYAETPDYCKVNIANLTGSGGRPILYYNASASIQNLVVSELILCNASGSSIKNVTIDGSPTLKNNGLVMLHTNRSNISAVNSTGNQHGIHFLYSFSNTVVN